MWAIGRLGIHVHDIGRERAADLKREGTLSLDAVRRGRPCNKIVDVLGRNILLDFDGLPFSDLGGREQRGRLDSAAGCGPALP